MLDVTEKRKRLKLLDVKSFCARNLSASEIITLHSQRRLRKRWRTNQKFSRTNRKTITEPVRAVGTPPQSPPYIQHPVEPTPARGRKRVRKDRAKAYRDMATLVSTATDGEMQKGLSQKGGCGRSIRILNMLHAMAILGRGAYTGGSR